MNLRGGIGTMALVIGLIAPAGAFAAPADEPTAQTGGAPTDAADVVVTARSREERAIDVPLTVNVVGADDIREKGVRSVFDLARLVPGFTYIANVRGQANVTMRGLSPNSLYPSKAGVGFFVDGMYLPGETASFNVQDLDRVEVLKGPQFTHFGRSTYAGAVNYITRVPTDDHVSGRALAEYSSNDSHELDLLVNVPVIRDGLYATISARDYDRGGVYREKNYDSLEGGQSSENVALSLLALPTPTTRIRIRASHDEDRDAHQISYTLYRNDLLPYSQAFPTGKTYPVFTLNEGDLSKLGASRAIDGANDGGRWRHRNFFYLTADQDLGGGYKLNYAGEYFDEYNAWLADVTNRRLTDPALSNPTQVLNPTENSTRTWTQQLRLESPSDSKLQWLVGLFYVNERYITFSRNGKVVLNPFSITGGVPAERDAPLVTDNKAAYFSVSYPVFDRVTLTAEGRYQSEEQSVDACDLASCQRYGAAFHQRANDFLPRVTIAFKPSEHLNFYALYSEGVKSAVINLSSSATTAAAALAYEQANYQKPERDRNYEVGVKASLFGGRLDASTAYYHMEVSDQQVSTFGVDANGNTTSYTGNGGRSRIDGAEVSLSGRLARGWTADFGANYAYHRYVGTTATNSTLITLFGTGDSRSSLKGLTSVETPRWTLNAATAYVIPVGADAITLRGNWNYMSARFADIPNLIRIAPQSRLNLSASYRRRDTEFTVFVNNVTNETNADDASVGYGNIVEQGRTYTGTSAAPSVIVNLPYPRTVGARLTQAF